jgi:N-dimethylarginine dimethylaminohydrolase
VRQHAGFLSLLYRVGAAVIETARDGSGQLDAIFADDLSIMTDAGAVLPRLSKLLRQAEVARHGRS